LSSTTNCQGGISKERTRSTSGSIASAGLHAGWLKRS
jgi:hypothetical protein